MGERRDFAARARLVQAICGSLADTEQVCTAQQIASAIGGVPVDVVRRVTKRLCARGLVRTVDVDAWQPTLVLKVPVHLIPV